MIKKSLFLICCLLLAVSVFAKDMDEQRINQLALQYLPDVVKNDYAPSDSQDELQNPIEQYHRSDEPGKLLIGNFTYLDFKMPGDVNQYLLLAWRGQLADDFYFRLLKSSDGGESFSIAQDSPCWYGGIDRNMTWRLWLNDLTGDGIPELIMESGGDGDSFDIFQWKEGKFVFICPVDEDSSPGSNPAICHIYSALESNGGVELMDLDGDNIAEVVVERWFERVQEPDSDSDNTSNHLEYISPTKIYKYNGTAYVLWKEIPKEDPYPVAVPTIGVVHPGTLPLSALEALGSNSSKGKAAGGNSDLQVLVSHPAGNNTVDDIDVTKFTCKNTSIPVKKSWPNGKYPDVSVANWEWEGCPVKQTATNSHGEWNPSPEDPWIPSPDGKYEYHFVGPYLELRLPRSLVFPDLLSWSQDYFSKNPDKVVYWANIPIEGKMQNGKLLAVNALVCIKKTGSDAKKK